MIINCYKKRSYPMISMFYLINAIKNFCISMNNTLKIDRIIEKNIDNCDISQIGHIYFNKNRIIKNIVPYLT